ncbi:hypothetical protein E3A20_28450 [Planctomyces bekefii]|uniref:Uncharacterized protein n=1 Tax=Planctomyces bekefii TaxID=1653850 RepID=A0A5C6M446_9PLAN|nr:hypothetical protein E3A20_28450 [Planctomyces bekefii]
MSPLGSSGEQPAAKKMARMSGSNGVFGIADLEGTDSHSIPELSDVNFCVLKSDVLGHTAVGPNKPIVNGKLA